MVQSKRSQGWKERLGRCSCRCRRGEGPLAPPIPDSLKHEKPKCVNVNPSWAKGYARKGAALHGSRRYDEAITTYEAGLKLEDSPALRKGLQEVKDAKGLLMLRVYLLMIFAEISV